MQDFFKRAWLPATVFLTGACVLVIEIVALRILAPYFGNTLYSASSVISVVLAALSVGYWFGGKLAARSAWTYPVRRGVQLTPQLNQSTLPNPPYSPTITPR